MKVRLEIGDKVFKADLTKPLDISIPLLRGGGPKAFYAPDYRVEPVRTDDFVGSTSEGGILNFYNIFINPHGNGTHTECMGHISKDFENLNENLKTFHFTSCLITVEPKEALNGDKLITVNDLEPHKKQMSLVDALILRTLPNTESKKSRNYSGANPPYMSPESIGFLNDCGIQHLLLDLPSVDREVDGGALASHKMFWSYPDKPELHKTITEMIYVDNDIKDGFYLLNLQIGSYDLDASPSKPVLYQLEEDD